MEKLLFDKTLREITRDYSATIALFIKHNIDFYCEGKQTISDLRNQLKGQFDEFLHELNNLLKREDQSYPVEINQWPLDLLADYIEKTHHRYTEEILVKIRSGLEDIQKFDAEGESMAIELSPLVVDLAKEMGGHMKKEELILFPFIRKMVKSSGSLEPPRFTTVENPIEMMEHEHNTTRDLMIRIRKLTNNYDFSGDTGGKMVYILTLIKALDKDLIQHLHVENNILFPKAIVMEKRKVSVGS